MYLHKKEKRVKREKIGEEEYINVIKTSHFFSRNAISISEKIRSWDPFYFLSFNLIEKHKEVQFGEIDENIHIVPRDSKYLLLQYKKRNSIDLYEFIYKVGKKEKLLHIINSFRSFLHITQILLKRDLQHLYFTNDSLLYVKRENRYILGNMDHVVDSKESLLLFTKKFFPQKVIWPLELHLLSYIQERRLESISRSNIEEVYDLVASAEASLTPFAKSYKKELKDAQLLSFDHLINQSREKIISWIYDQRHSWNLYSLSVYYLEIIQNIEDHIGPHPFLNSFSLLIQQTSFKREKIDTFHKKWEELLYSITEIEWNN